MSAKWQTGLTFSDRLAATSKISAAYTAANPNCAPSEASKYAKGVEESARKHATSMTEYAEQCAEATRRLLHSAESGSETENHVPEASVVEETTDPGVCIGRYTNARHFKDGLFSEVYKASLPETESTTGRGRTVALKVTTTSLVRPPHNAEREARILLVAISPHVVPLLESFKQPGGKLVLAFPYMLHDLDVLLHRRQLPSQARRPILRDLFSGLAHLHSLDIIHRDIKPSNILLASPTGPAYIADFGVAWSATDAASEPAKDKILDVGTTCYRPPELLFGHAAYDCSLDLWAAGCVAAQVICLNGKTLFDAGDLGSELALIKSIFETLGTPDTSVWPEAATFPDWGKMNFWIYSRRPWEQILPGVEVDALDFVSRLVVYESGSRLRPEQALQHPYLKT